MKNLRLRKRGRFWKERLVPLTLGAGIIFIGLFPTFASAIVVDGPGLVMIIDGNDPGPRVETFSIDATFPFARYDFGFVAASGFTPIALAPEGPVSLVGSYPFQGGTLVDFALRDNASGSIFSIADPADYADQVYTGPIDPSFSVRPPVPFTYYHTLLLQWDLDHNGVMDAGFTATDAIHPHDGLAPVPAPVPLPPVFLLFGSGLAGLIGMTWKRWAEG